MNRGALVTAASVALVVVSACTETLDCPTSSGCGGGYTTVTFAAVPSGANVIPALAPADTSARASATLNSATLAYTYSVLVAPSGTIDSIALYQVSYRDPLPPSATAILCAGAAACASTSGMGTVVPPATPATIGTSMLSFGQQMVFFTTTAQKAAGGAMRGTPYLVP